MELRVTYRAFVVLREKQNDSLQGIDAVEMLF